jgi:hypothetical protein
MANPNMTRFKAMSMDEKSGYNREIISRGPQSLRRDHSGRDCRATNVITEISSVRGDKNSTSSKQDWSHSWHKINATALQKGSKTIPNDQKFEELFTSSECARVCT